MYIYINMQPMLYIYTLSIDIKYFFPSVTLSIVFYDFNIIQHVPFAPSNTTSEVTIFGDINIMCSQTL